MTISKKALGIGAGVLITLLVAAWFVFMSPKDTSVTLTVGLSSLSSTQTQTVTGSVTPAESGRLVVVEVRGKDHWAEVARTSTDATGSFKAEFEMTERGSQKVRVRVDKDGRQSAVTSVAQSVSVLAPTQLQVQIPKFARTDRPLRITGRVGPANARQLKVEVSTDGQTWSTAGEGATRPSGQFAVTADGFVAGLAQVRLVVTESETEAMAESAVRQVSVEDYKAAGKRYLEIVAAANKLNDEWSDLTGSTDLEKVKAVARRLSEAHTKEAREFRQYGFWPQQVKAQIELLAKSSVLRADYYNLCATSKNFEEMNAIDYSEPKGADNAPAFIRSALGLPKRGA